MMASIPSPTGEEGQLARAVVDVMNASGVGAFYQPMDDDSRQCRSVESPGSGDGVRSYCFMRPWIPPFPTDEEEECPWIGDRLPGEMTTNAYVRDGDVVGMGAENPKGYAACVVAAAQAIKAADVPLERFAVGRIGSGRDADKPAAVVAKVQCRSRRRLRFHVGTGRARRFCDHRETGLVGGLGRGRDCVGSK